jgi:hypothetical protein
LRAIPSGYEQLEREEEMIWAGELISQFINQKIVPTKEKFMNSVLTKIAFAAVLFIINFRPIYSQNPDLAQDLNLEPNH